jgi:hypothetical protein
MAKINSPTEQVMLPADPCLYGWKRFSNGCRNRQVWTESTHTQDPDACEEFYDAKKGITRRDLYL